MFSGGDGGLDVLYLVHKEVTEHACQIWVCVWGGQVRGAISSQNSGCQMEKPLCVFVTVQDGLPV